MQLFVKCLTGKTITLDIDRVLGSRVRDVKRAIEAKEGIPWREQRLICGERQLKDRTLLSEAGLGRDVMLQLVLKAAPSAESRLESDEYSSDEDVVRRRAENQKEKLRQEAAQRKREAEAKKKLALKSEKALNWWECGGSESREKSAETERKKRGEEGQHKIQKEVGVSTGPPCSACGRVSGSEELRGASNEMEKIKEGETDGKVTEEKSDSSYTGRFHALCGRCWSFGFGPVAGWSFSVISAPSLASAGGEGGPSLLLQQNREKKGGGGKSERGPLTVVLPTCGGQKTVVSPVFLRTATGVWQAFDMKEGMLRGWEGGEIKWGEKAPETFLSALEGQWGGRTSDGLRPQYRLVPLDLPSQEPAEGKSLSPPPVSTAESALVVQTDEGSLVLWKNRVGVSQTKHCTERTYFASTPKQWVSTAREAVEAFGLPECGALCRALMSDSDSSPRVYKYALKDRMDMIGLIEGGGEESLLRELRERVGFQNGKQLKDVVNEQTRGGDTLLMRAVYNQQERCVRVLLDAGAKVNAVYEGEFITKFPEWGVYRDRYMSIAFVNDRHTPGQYIEFLQQPHSLFSGWPGTKGLTALWLAVWRDNEALVRVLLDKGADVRAVPERLVQQSKYTTELIRDAKRLKDV